MRTDRGVFSHGRLDAGTAVLLRSAPPLPGRRASPLDLGCGTGAIALTMALRSPGLDGVGRRRQRAGPGAVRGERRRQRRRQRHASPRPTRCPPTSASTSIWSNPPIRIGKAALHELLLRVARPPDARRRRPCSSSRSTSAPTPCSAGSPSQGWPTTRARLAPRATASSRSIRVFECHRSVSVRVPAAPTLAMRRNTRMGATATGAGGRPRCGGGSPSGGGRR